MKHVYVSLAEEVAGWPDVSTRPMFGLRAIYRKKVIFALLPEKRALESLTAIWYKQEGKWVSFEVRDENDMGRALAVIEKAYGRAKPSSRAG
jgi:hypothetical protein